MSDDPPTRALIVGGGSIGTRHLGNLRTLGVPEIEVAEPDPARTEALREEWDVATHPGIEEALDGDPFDLVLVCSPTHLHAAHARAAVDHGAHVFVEKPLSHDRGGLADLVARATEQGLTTLVGCNMRFHPMLRKARALLDEGAIGPVRAARIHAGSYLPGWHPDEDHREMYSAKEAEGGGVLLDFIHEIDYLRWMLGEPREVACLTGRAPSLGIETETHAGLLARLDGDAVVQVHLDYLQRAYDRGLHLVGDDGVLRWSWGRGLRWTTGGGDAWKEAPEDPDWELNDMYIEEMRHLIECIRKRRPTTAPLAEGWRSLEVVLAAKGSAATGRNVEVAAVPEARGGTGSEAGGGTGTEAGGGTGTEAGSGTGASGLTSEGGGSGG